MKQKKTIRSLWTLTAGMLTGTRRVVTLLLTLLLTLTAQSAWAWDGAGTEDNPYLIKNVTDLNTLSTQSQTNDFDGVYFQLYNNITFDKTQPNNYEPIASGSVYFQGNFDGNGKTISGVRISTTEGYQGLFASVGANGVVKNLKVADTRIEAWNMSGVIASYCEGLIADCSISNDVTLHAINPNGSQYGSFAGLVRDGTVSHCVSEASITLSEANGAYNSMGGLVGDLSGGTIEHSVFAGYMQISSFSMNTNNFAVVGKHTSGTIRNNYYTSSSLTAGYSNVTFAYTVTVPSQFVVSGVANDKNSYYNGLFFNQKYYTPSGTTFYVFPASGNGTSTFDVQKTSTGSTDATNVASNYTMPAYDITLVFRGNMPHYDSTYGCYEVYDESTWNMVADCVAAGVDFSGKTLRLKHDVTVSRPIGDSDHPFKGTFDGTDTYGTIRHITFNSTATGAYCAPFANIYQATLRNLNVTGTINTAYQYSSGLVGKAVNSTIENCLSTVTINATLNGAGYHGGLVGYSSAISMSNCIFAGSMQGSNTSAWSGIIGFDAFQTELTKCLFTPTSVNVNTTDCYQFAYKNPELISMANLLTLTNCYYTTALGSVQDGGILAYTATLPEAIEPTDASDGVFYNGKLYIGSGDIANLKYLVNAGGEGVTLSAITAKDASNNNVAVTDNGDNTYSITMPAKNITVSGVMTDLWGLAGGADGSEDHPYLITTPAGLDLLAAKVNGGTDYANTYFKLGDDITYTYASGDTWDLESSTTNNFTTIGTGTKKFKGHFDGDNHTIRGIRINSGDRSVGLFGNLYTNDAEIKNVILDDARITSSSYFVGGILGYTGDDAAQSKVTNCHVKNVLVKGDYEVGGVVGSTYKGTVSDCTSGATVTGSKYLIGGVVGWNRGTLKKSFYYGSGVTAGDHKKSSAGAITVNDGGTLQNNYYLPCPVTMKKDSYTTYTTNNGVGKPCNEQLGLQTTYTRYAPADVSTNDGGLPVYAVTLGTVSNGTIAVATANVTHNSTDYFKAGATVTVTATPDDGYSVGSVAYNDGSDHDITASGTFTMPSKAVTVSSAFSLNAFSLAYDSNNDAVLTTWNSKIASVTLSGRTLYKNGSWNTLCLPFDLTIAGSPLSGDGMTAKAFSSSSNLTDGTLRLDFINAPATIPAGTPFIVKWTSGSNISNPVFTGVTVNNAAPVAAVSADGNVTFTGSYSPLASTTGLMFDEHNTTNGACHVALSTTAPTRPGYTLTGGWNTAADGTGTDVTTIPFDAQVYAKGTENIATLTEADPIAPLTAMDGKQTKVSFTRSGLTAGKYSTICLPFDFTASENCTFYTFKGVTQDAQSNWTADIEETTAPLTANTPYIFKTESATSVIFSNPAVVATASYSDATANTSVTDWTFQGTYSAISLPNASEYDYGFAAGDGSTVEIGSFVHLVSGASAAPFRAYLKYTGSDDNWAKARMRSASVSDALPNRIIVRIVGANGDATVIGTLDTRTGEISTGDWYSIDGHRLQGKPAKKGLYINNGRKVVIK